MLNGKFAVPGVWCQMLILMVMLLAVANPSAQVFARGADVGWLTEMEAAGRRFYDASGTQMDLMDILRRDYCINSIRLRVWVNPVMRWSGKADVTALAKRAHQKGMRLMINFHYSDDWADPGKQFKPVAWEGFTVAQLTQAIYNHTFEVLDTLRREGVVPEWVQVGNETNDGMLWPDGRPSLGTVQMQNYAQFVLAGHNAAKAVFPNVQTIVHVANGFDNGLFRWNIGGIINNGAQFDMIAMSLYPEPTNFDSLVTLALANMNDLVQRFNKPVMVSEIGMSVSFPAQSRTYVERIIAATQSVNGGRGRGVFWWEPQAYNWRGYDKVAWNNNGRPTVAMEGFNFRCPLSSSSSIPSSSSTIPPLSSSVALSSSSSQVVCIPQAITPYTQIDQQPWQPTATAQVAPGQTVRFGPHPMSGGSWSWSGPLGFSAGTREITISAVQSNRAGTYFATFSSGTGCTTTFSFNINVEASVSVVPLGVELFPSPDLSKRKVRLDGRVVHPSK